MAQMTPARPGADAPMVNRPPDPHASWPVQFYRSAVGKKWVMAISGLAMWGFLFAHMIGNLKLYIGKEPNGRYALDEYGEALRRLLYPIMPPNTILWILRAGLILMLILHVHAAITLTQMNRRSRPMGYQAPRDYVAANFASRSMRITGVIIFFYIIFHLIDLSIRGTGARWVGGEVHNNLIASLSRPGVALIYVIANIAVSLHLYHGTWSMFQTMGVNNPRWNGARRLIALGMATLVGIPNILFPILIVTNVVN